MAVVWEKKSTDRHYQVRRAGHSVRLYTNGVFHSQFNPRYPLGGNVWDLLVLPLLYRKQLPNRVLLLGVGGGAVVRQLRALWPDVAIVGVELDSQHLRIAKRFFGLGDDPKVQLHCAEAQQWLRDYQGEGFDCVIEDCFGEQDGQPVRAIAADKAWCQQLRRHLQPGGTVVLNFGSAGELRQCDFRLGKPKRGKPTHQRVFSMPGYENRIGAFYWGEAGSQWYRRHWQALLERHGRRIGERVAARSRTLSRLPARR